MRCTIVRGHAYSDECRLPVMEVEGGVVMMSVDGVEGMWGVSKLGKIRNIDGLRAASRSCSGRLDYCSLT